MTLLGVVLPVGRPAGSSNRAGRPHTALRRVLADTVQRLAGVVCRPPARPKLDPFTGIVPLVVMLTEDGGDGSADFLDGGVDADDPAFAKPSKPVGSFLDEETAKERMALGQDFLP